MGAQAQGQQGQQQPYNNGLSPMGGMNPMMNPMNGTQKPLNNGYAGLAPQTGATMMPYQGGMNNMPNYANSGNPISGNAIQGAMFGGTFNGMNQQAQMLNQQREKEFSALNPQQQQNATQYGDAYYGQQPSAMTPAQMASSGLSQQVPPEVMAQLPQYAQQQLMQNTLRGTPANQMNGLLNVPQQQNRMGGMNFMNRFGRMNRGFGR
jgi:hypothetical protein